MNRALFAIGAVICVAVLSGCFIDYTGSSHIQFDGNITQVNDGVTMDGAIVLSGEDGDGTYENISLHAYDEAGRLIHSKRVGSFSNGTNRISFSLSLNRTPEYLILQGPDLYAHGAEVEYYYRAPSARGGYGEDDVTKRCELPVTPEC